MSGRVVVHGRARGPNQLIDDVDRCGAAAGGRPMFGKVGSAARAYYRLLLEAPVFTGAMLAGALAGGLIARSVLEVVRPMGFTPGPVGIAAFVVVWIPALFGTALAFLWVTGRDVVDEDDRAQVAGPTLFAGVIAVAVVGMVAAREVFAEMGYSGGTIVVAVAAISLLVAIITKRR